MVKGEKGHPFFCYIPTNVPHAPLVVRSCLAAHIDFFPTLAELSGAKLTDEVMAQVEGRSLISLFTDPKAMWKDRILFTHAGRWPKGAESQDHKYAYCSVRNTRWHMVCNTNGAKQWQLFDVHADYGEKTNVADKHPEILKKLDAAYDRWWDSVQTGLVNEDAVGPKLNPYKELFEKQFGLIPKRQ